MHHDGRQFFKVCPADQDADEPSSWGLAYASSYHEAAIEHFKYLESMTHAGFFEREMLVTHEGGGVTRVFCVRAAQIMTYSADEVTRIDRRTEVVGA
jgi:hypothetical protein